MTIMDQSRAFSVHSKTSRVELLGAVLLTDYVYAADEPARDETTWKVECAIRRRGRPPRLQLGVRNRDSAEATFLYLLAPVDKEGPSDNKAGTNTTGGVFYHSSCLYAKEFLDYTGISWTNIWVTLHVTICGQKP